MHKPEMYETLNDAIDTMLVEHQTTQHNAGPGVSELLMLAAELRALPSPRFKARLKAELLQATEIQLIGTSRRNTQPLFRDVLVPQPVNKSRFAISLAAHAAAVALLVASSLWMAKNAEVVKRDIVSFVPLTGLDMPLAKKE